MLQDFPQFRARRLENVHMWRSGHLRFVSFDQKQHILKLGARYLFELFKSLIRL